MDTKDDKSIHLVRQEITFHPKHLGALRIRGQNLIVYLAKLGRWKVSQAPLVYPRSAFCLNTVGMETLPNYVIMALIIGNILAKIEKHSNNTTLGF